MFQFLIGIAITGLGLWGLVSIFVPAWRGCWKGTRVACGAVSMTGFGLVFTAAGILLIFSRNFKEPEILALAGLPLIAGVPLVLIGNWLDFRRKSTRT